MSEEEEENNYTDSDLTHKSFIGVSFIESDFSNADLSFSDLTGGKLISCILFETKFIKSILINVEFQGLNLIDVKMMSAKLKNSVFTNTRISDCNLSSTSLNDKTDMTDVVMNDNIEISNTDLINVILINADLSDSILYYVNFLGSDLTKANFTNVDLSTCDFSDTILDETILTGANLQDLKISRKTIIKNVIIGDVLISSIEELMNLGAVIQEEEEKTIKLGFDRIQVFNPEESQFLCARLEPKQNNDSILNGITRYIKDNIPNNGLQLLGIFHVTRISHNEYKVDDGNNVIKSIYATLLNYSKYPEEYDIYFLNLLKEKCIREIHRLKLLNVGDSFIIPFDYFYSRSSPGFHLDTAVIQDKYIIDPTYVSLTYLLPEGVRLPGPEIMLNPIFLQETTNVYRFSVFNFSTVYFNNKLLIHSTPYEETNIGLSENVKTGIRGELHTISSFSYPPNHNREEGRKSLIDNKHIPRNFLRNWYLKPEDHNIDELNDELNYINSIVIKIEDDVNDLDINIHANTRNIIEEMEGKHFGGKINILQKQTLQQPRQEKQTLRQRQTLRQQRQTLRQQRQTLRQQTSRQQTSRQQRQSNKSRKTLRKINKTTRKYKTETRKYKQKIMNIEIPNKMNFLIMTKKDMKYSIN
jgi:uncharacterized protein YjbI with pentapeptide repeats